MHYSLLKKLIFFTFWLAVLVNNTSGWAGGWALHVQCVLCLQMFLFTEMLIT